MALPVMRAARFAFALLAAVPLAMPGALGAQDRAYVAPEDELALARVIIAAMYPADRREQMILDMSSNLARQFAESTMSDPLFKEPGIKAIFDKFLAEMPDRLRPGFAKHLPLIFEATAVAYTRAFTLEELTEISRFAQTPAGQRYFSSLSGLLADPAVEAANQAMMAEIIPQQRDEGVKVGRQVEDYLRAHPEVVERLRKARAGTD